MKTIFTAAASAIAFSASALAVNTVKVDGSDFVDSVTGDRFNIIGVAYQPGGSSGFTTTSDPLSNSTACLRDAVLMQELGVNAIRCYNVEPTLNHDECASIFNEAGIYMIIDVNSPFSGQYLDRSDPSGTYTLTYLEHIFAVVEAFKSYPNTLGFFAGNEIINDADSASIDPPYIRAVQRDLKQYIASRASRTIPVGYSAADVDTLLQDQYSYLSCSLSNETVNGEDLSRSDFFGLNSYSWCGDASYTSAGYNTLVSTFSNNTIPVFFSEYGCNLVEPRTFTEVAALYGSEMSDVFSGGLVYEWTQESNDYGLVSIGADNATATLLVDFVNLKGELDQLNLTQLETGNSTAETVSAPSCAASLIGTSGVSDDFDLPSAPSGAAALISSGISSAPTGKIVSVTKTSVGVACYATNGALLEDLVLKAVNGSNTPSSESLTSSAVSSATSTGTSTSTATATGSSASSTSTKKSAASAAQVGTGGMVAALIGAVVLL